MLDNLGEAVLIAQALVTLDLIPYGERLLKQLVARAKAL